MSETRGRPSGPVLPRYAARVPAYLAARGLHLHRMDGNGLPRWQLMACKTILCQDPDRCFKLAILPH